MTVLSPAGSEFDSADPSVLGFFSANAEGLPKVSPFLPPAALVPSFQLRSPQNTPSPVCGKFNGSFRKLQDNPGTTKNIYDDVGTYANTKHHF